MGGEVVRVNVLAERHFVGSLLHINVTDRERALAQVDEHHITDPAVLKIYRAVRSLHERTGIVEPAGVIDELMRNGMPPEGQGNAAALIGELMDETPLSIMWPYYAHLLREEHQRQQVRDLGDRLSVAADTWDLAALRDLLERGCRDLTAHLRHTSPKVRP